MWHNNQVSGGKLVYLSLDADHSFIKITPISHEKDTTKTDSNGASVASQSKNNRAELEQESLTYPLERIQHVEVGKKPPSVLSRPNFDHVHPMKCFSISILEWDGNQQSLDFEVATPLERTAILSTLLKLLKRLRSSDHSTIQEEISTGDKGLDTNFVVTSSESGNSCSFSDRPNENIAKLALPSLSLSKNSLASRELSVIEDPVSSEQEQLTTSCTGMTSAELVAKDASVEWCTDSICVFALKDIAYTWNELFYKSDEQSATHHLCGQCSVPHEKCTCSEGYPSRHHFMESYSTNACSQPGMVSLLEDHMWSDEDSRGGELYDIKNIEVNDRFCNRAAVLNGQAQRVEQLRTDMTFDTVENPRKFPFLQMTKSSDDAAYSDQYTNQNGTPSMLNKSVAPEKTLPDLLHQLMGRTIPDDTGIKSQDEVLYYDSDPGDVKPRNHRTGPRRAQAAIENKDDTAQTASSSMTMAQSHVLSMMRTKTKAIDESSVQAMLEVSRYLVSAFFKIIWILLISVSYLDVVVAVGDEK